MAYWENAVLGHWGIFFTVIPWEATGEEKNGSKAKRSHSTLTPSPGWSDNFEKKVLQEKCWETFRMSGLHCCVFVNCFYRTSKDKPPACQRCKTSCLHTLLFIWWGDVKRDGKLPQTVKTGGNSKASMWSSNPSLSQSKGTLACSVFFFPEDNDFKNQKI